MKKHLVTTLFLLVSTNAMAGMVEINLNTQTGKKLDKNHVCEWRVMNENGKPEEGNPFYGSAWRRELPVGRYVFTTNCGNEGGGSMQVLSTSKQETYYINLFRF